MLEAIPGAVTALARKEIFGKRCGPAADDADRLFGGKAAQEHHVRGVHVARTCRLFPDARVDALPQFHAPPAVHLVAHRAATDAAQLNLVVVHCCPRLLHQRETKMPSAPEGAPVVLEGIFGLAGHLRQFPRPSFAHSTLIRDDAQRLSCGAE